MSAHRLTGPGRFVTKRIHARIWCALMGLQASVGRRRQLSQNHRRTDFLDQIHADACCNRVMLA